MKLTNNSNLPPVIYDFLSQDFYDGDKVGASLSATTLLKPVQAVVLERRYADKIEVDCKDRIWSLFGSGVHAVLERIENMEPIERLSAEVNGRTVSGKPDYIKGTVLKDFKVTSSFTLAYGSRTDEWREQLSIYRWLYKQVKGIELDKTGFIVAIFRDWAERDVARVKNYPKAPIMEIPIELMSLEETERFVSSRVEKITAAEKLPDDSLPRCTHEERWWNQTKQVYMKCEKYCPAYKFCQQVKRENEKIEQAEEFTAVKEVEFLGEEPMKKGGRKRGEYCNLSPIISPKEIATVVENAHRRGEL